MLKGTSRSGHSNAAIRNLSPSLLLALLFSVLASPSGRLSLGGDKKVQLLRPTFCQPCKSLRNRKLLSHWFLLKSQSWLSLAQFEPWIHLWTSQLLGGLENTDWLGLGHMSITETRAQVLVAPPKPCEFREQRIPKRKGWKWETKPQILTICAPSHYGGYRWSIMVFPPWTQIQPQKP